MIYKVGVTVTCIMIMLLSLDKCQVVHSATVLYREQPSKLAATDLLARFQIIKKKSFAYTPIKVAPKPKEVRRIVIKLAPKPVAPPAPKPKPVVIAAAKPKGYVIKVTEEEVNLLARLVTAEAKNQPYEGMVAVAGVVINRVQSDDFGDSVESVVYQKGQFQPVSNRSINKKAIKEAAKAAIEALQGSDPSKGALFFYNPKIAKHSPMPNADVTAVIEDHTFLK